MNYAVEFYPETSIGGFTDIDDTFCFYTRVHSIITSSSVLLDFGCGRGACQDDPVRLRRELRIFKGKVSRVIGLDVDQKGRDNPFVDEFRLLKPGDPWPVEGSSIDIAIADQVVEHLADPAFFFSECKRVLKPSGYLCIRTTNVLGYVGLGALLIPRRFHNGVLGVLRKGIKEDDSFPTIYRCNTIFQLRKMMTKYGFDHVCYGHNSEPNYLSFSKIAYAMGVFYQKYCPGFLKLTIYAFGRSI